ncbi:MAG: metal ABC transporter ATP-binding protein [Anaerolineales bacterium]
MLKELQRTNQILSRRYIQHQPGAPILRLDGVDLAYGGRSVLEKITFDALPGERMAVIGPNGAGKSTLFRLIAGVLTPTSGHVTVFGSEPDGHICIAYVPQRAHVDWKFPVNVADVVMMGRLGKIGLMRRARRVDWERVYAALDMVNLRSLAKRQIQQLSGGQQQRMFIARALAQEAELILMDEPLTGLDSNAQEELFQALDALRGSNVTVLMALHDLKLAAERFDRVLLLNRRILHLGTAAEVFTTDHLQQAYGGHLHILPIEAQKALAVGDTCCEQDEEIESPRTIW